MFSTLTEKFQTLLTRFTYGKSITEDNIRDSINEVRLALLEADVQYSVVKNFVKGVKERAVGEKLISSISPGQLFVKIVHDQLVELFGKGEKELQVCDRPYKLLMCGLQGSGKTTHSAKIALYLKKKKGIQRPCLVACDLQRPAAIDQLKKLAENAGLFFFTLSGEKNPVAVAEAALQKAQLEKYDALIFDTAGRLHIDEVLMEELSFIKKVVQPHDVLLTMNAATGQDSVRTAEAFSKQIGITGSCITMLDGISRGGAALSIAEVTETPVLFEGHGEKIEDLRVFNPQSMADRILGMGDTINLVRHAQEHIDEEEAKSLEKKIRKAEFSYADFLRQMQTMKKMGSFKTLLGMLPGMSKLKELPFDENEIKRVEALILSMTADERDERVELSVARRKRIAKGSGTTLDDINRLVKSFKQVKQFFKQMPNMKQLEKMIGGKIWQ
ncbi:MAG: signal recognition particle protein [Chlamydia sp.]